MTQGKPGNCIGFPCVLKRGIELDEKKINFLWSISLIAISLANAIIAITNAFDANVPDAVAIILSAVILAAVLVLLYTSFKKWQEKL
ncbi:MAG: hypothetical protein IKM05_06035 [Clostridia bacterium]|nr:hypothetical protein [Clostridia bacterium]